MPVEMMMRCWFWRARRRAGSKYASVLPVPVPASTMRWRLSLKAFSMARAMSYWPGRCSKERVERERSPPGAKKSWSVGISPVGLGLAGAIWMGADTGALSHDSWVGRWDYGSTLPLPIKVCKVFEGEDLGLDLGGDFGNLASLLLGFW